ncbi:hypothetical protein [Bordetella sp. N]|uniref:hypothetical protein n=1 Tax=Bordetella sp. N TaxID=1746199 RepID=UPI00070E55A8|nr:hypothetical protein [Bordetella sp. N]ALM84191.1 hypothetical protein ASB57_15505 [Bordetella sp. N]
MERIADVSIDGYQVQCRIVARDGDYRVRVTTRRKLASGRPEDIVDVPSPLIFESEEEAERHARNLMLSVRGIRASGKPVYTIL